MIELLTDPSAWVALVTLSLLEIVLGIDNIIFISILVGRLPEARREKARIVGPGARHGHARGAAVLHRVAHEAWCSPGSRCGAMNSPAATSS